MASAHHRGIRLHDRQLVAGAAASATRRKPGGGGSAGHLRRRAAAIAFLLLPGGLLAACGNPASSDTTTATTSPTTTAAVTTSVSSTAGPEPATTSAPPTTPEPTTTTTAASTTTTTLPPWEVPGFPQVLPPEAIPWEEVGAGWLLVRYRQAPPAASGAVDSPALLLIDPDDTIYGVLMWRSGDWILDWSPDGHRVLSFAEGMLRITDLREGTTTIVPDDLYRGQNFFSWESAARFTRPTGRDIMVGLVSWGERVHLECLHTDGTQFAQLIDLELPPSNAYDPEKVDVGVTWLYLPSGTRVVVATREGISLLSNQGDLIRALDTPGLGCILSRWWDQGSVLAACYDRDWAASPCWTQAASVTGGGGRSLWSVPIDGSPAARLTPVPVCDPDTGSLEHWPEYVDALTAGGVVAAQTASCCACFGGLDLIDGDTITGWSGYPGTVPCSLQLLTTRGDRLLIWEVAISEDHVCEDVGGIMEVAADGTFLRTIIPPDLGCERDVQVLTTEETLLLAGW